MRGGNFFFIPYPHVPCTITVTCLLDLETLTVISEEVCSVFIVKSISNIYWSRFALTSLVLLNFSGRSDELCRCQACLGKYTLLGDEENPRLSIYDRRLPCCGCGIGWSWWVNLLWQWTAIVFFSLVNAVLNILLLQFSSRFLVPYHLVRCSSSLLLQVLQSGPSWTAWTRCFCCSG